MKNLMNRHQRNLYPYQQELHYKSTKNKKLVINPIIAAYMLIFASCLASTHNAFAQTNTNTQQQPASSSLTNSPNKSGTITNVQTDAQGKWNLNGKWSLNETNTETPTFSSEFAMAKSDGSAKHTHTISDFKMTGTPSTNSSGTIYAGTATVSMKEKPATNVPVTITISNNGNFGIMIDPKSTNNHFETHQLWVK